MKSWSGIRLKGSGAAVAALLLSLALVVLWMTHRIEQDATSLQIDSVPGLIEANRLRSIYSEEYASTITAAEAPTAATASALTGRFSTSDAAAAAALERYRRTIQIDPQRDLVGLATVDHARRAYLAVRGLMLDALQRGDVATAHTLTHGELTERFGDLMRACDALVDYNAANGTAYATLMEHGASALRLIAVGMILLVGLAVVVLTRNLRQQLRVERDSRQSEAKFRLVFEISPHSMVISRRPDGKILAANNAFRRQYGIEAEDLSRYTALKIGVWESEEERTRAITEFEKHGRLVNYRKTGAGRTILLSAEPIEVDGQPCLVAIGQDITEQVAIQDQLARSLAELRTIFDSAGTGIALVDRDGRVVRGNRALQTFLGYSAEELARIRFPQITHPDEIERDTTNFARLLAGELSRVDVEKRYVRKDGSIVWGHLTLSAVPSTDGPVQFAISLVEDITERKRTQLALAESESARQQLQQQLIVAQKLEALGQLAGGVAHDFNNMLAAIMLHLDVMKLTPGLAPTFRDSVDELMKTSRRAAGLTRQLLLFSRRQPVQRQAVDIDALISNLLKMLQRLVGSHFTLDHVHGSAPLEVLGDPGMLEQVIMNLVVNARDAMARGGRIELRTERLELSEAEAAAHPGARPGPQVRITVTDTGCGMSAAVRQRIFEPFFTTKEAGKGTGLGLSTVFGIVRQHRGWIDVTSVEGQGSTFSVYLPADGEARPRPVEPAASVTRAQGRETLLVADDNEQLRTIAARVLRSAGYTVLEAATGVLARRMLEAPPEPIDLVLTDLVMPGGVMGDDLIAVARRTGRAKIILMSSHSGQVDLNALESQGVTYLGKPFTAERLLGTLRAVLDGTPVSAVPE